VGGFGFGFEVAAFGVVDAVEEEFGREDFFVLVDQKLLLGIHC